MIGALVAKRPALPVTLPVTLPVIKGAVTVPVKVGDATGALLVWSAVMRVEITPRDVLIACPASPVGETISVMMPFASVVKFEGMFRDSIRVRDIPLRHS
jgi:hypothetical protein